MLRRNLRIPLCAKFPVWQGRHVSSSPTLNERWAGFRDQISRKPARLRNLATWPYYGHVTEPWSHGLQQFKISKLSRATVYDPVSTSVWIFAEMISIFNAVQIFLLLYLSPKRGWRILFATGGHPSGRALAMINNPFATGYLTCMHRYHDFTAGRKLPSQDFCTGERHVRQMRLTSDHLSL